MTLRDLLFLLTRLAVFSSVLFLVSCTAPAPPTGSIRPTGSPPQVITPSASVGTFSPPPGFEDRLPLWIGDRTTGSANGPYQAGAWVGLLGHDLAPVESGGAGGSSGTVVAGDAYYLGPDPGGNGHESVLWQVASDGTARSISRARDFAIAADARVAMVSRVGGQGRDAGVVGVPLDGSEPYVSIPAARGFARTGLAATTDAAIVATGRCGNGDEFPLTMELTSDGRVRDLEVIGIPLGFDATGRLIFWEGCAPGRIGRLAVDGAREVLVADSANAARVTRDGRFVVAWFPREDLRAQEVRIVDLVTGEMRTRELDGYWALTPVGDNEFAVFEGLPTGDTEKLRPLVISLADGWVAILPALG